MACVHPNMPLFKINIPEVRNVLKYTKTGPSDESILRKSRQFFLKTGPSDESILWKNCLLNS
jgi:hypothetical protein